MVGMVEFVAAGEAVLGGVAAESVETDDPPGNTSPQNYADSAPLTR